MDAKPQRPRALRVHDENMPPPAGVGSTMPAKTLHQRTKSTPAFSTLMQAGAVKAANKKVLGEVNANIRVVQPAKDDSEVGKASPGKITVQDIVKAAAVTGTFTKPATRPLAPKPAVQNTALTAVTRPMPAVLAESEPVKKVVPKKSTKVLKDVQMSNAPSETESKKPSAVASVRQTVAATKPPAQAVAQLPLLADRPICDVLPVQRQEFRKTENVPLRDEPMPRPVVKAAYATNSHLPPGFRSDQEYASYLQFHEAQYQLQQGPNVRSLADGSGSYASDALALPEQYCDLEEDEDEYDDGYTTARSFGLRGEHTGGVTTILAPKYTELVKEELRLAKDHVGATRSPDDIEDEAWDTSMVAEYGDEIFDYMRDLESRMAPNPRYMEQQQEIQWSMRAVLMDWVIQVHQRFSLLPETLFLTANYIDRFLSCKIVSLGKLQLVGATAIFVAAKYEEVQCPTISEIIYMVDGGYSADELLKAERFMLSMLQFELGWPGPMSFLRRISKADDYDLETRTVAKYFLEVTIMDERFVGCTPSFLAAGAHCMARLMIHNGDWSKAHVYYSNYTWTQLRQLLLAIFECCEEPYKHHAAVYDKYTDKRYKHASSFVAGKLAQGFRVPKENPPALPLSPPQSAAGLLI